MYYQTEYWTSSLSNARKKPKMVRNMTRLAVSTRPHAPPVILTIAEIYKWLISQGLVFFMVKSELLILDSKRPGVGFFEYPNFIIKLIFPD